MTIIAPHPEMCHKPRRAWAVKKIEDKHWHEGKIYKCPDCGQPMKFEDRCYDCLIILEITIN